MPATHSIELHFPLPAHLTPDAVIKHLQTYEPIINAQAFTVGHTPRTVDPQEVAKDTLFSGDEGFKLEAYDITERVPIIPILGISKVLKFPAVFQSFPKGVRCRAAAPSGVMVWSTFEVQERDAGGGGEWELVERARVECSVLLKPFVVGKFEAAHRELCQKVIDGLKDRVAAP